MDIPEAGADCSRCSKKCPWALHIGAHVAIHGIIYVFGLSIHCFIGIQASIQSGWAMTREIALPRGCLRGCPKASHLCIHRSSTNCDYWMSWNVRSNGQAYLPERMSFGGPKLLAMYNAQNHCKNSTISIRTPGGQSVC